MFMLLVYGLHLQEELAWLSEIQEVEPSNLCFNKNSGNSAAFSSLKTTGIVSAKHLRRQAHIQILTGPFTRQVTVR